MKKIDAHVHLIEHICGIGSEGELRSLGGGMVEYATGRKFRLIPEEFGDQMTPEAMINLFEKHDVEKGICLQGNYAGFQNLYTYESCQKYPNRLLAAATYDPFFSKSDLVRDHLFKDLGIKIIKMEVSNGSGLMANHPTVDLDGEVMNDVYKFANDNHLFFYIDIGRYGNNCYQVDALANVVKKYPNITFIICHLTAPQIDQLEILKYNLKVLNNPNVYYDLASLPNNTKEPYPFNVAQSYIRLAIDMVGKDKLLWGSDVPAAMTRTSYIDSYKYIEESNLFTLEEKKCILYDNACKVFNL